MNKKLLDVLEKTCANLTANDLSVLKKEIDQFFFTKSFIRKGKSLGEKLIDLKGLEIAELYLDRKKMKEISLTVGLTQSSIRPVIKKIKFQLLGFLKEEKDLILTLDDFDQVLISSKLRQECLEYLKKRQNTKSESTPLKRMPLGLDTPIKDAFLSIRTQNCLMAHGFLTMREVSETKQISLRKIKNFGSKGLAEVNLFISINQDLDSEVIAKPNNLSRAYLREPKIKVPLNTNHAFKIKTEKLA